MADGKKNFFNREYKMIPEHMKKPGKFHLVKEMITQPVVCYIIIISKIIIA